MDDERIEARSEPAPIEPGHPDPEGPSNALTDTAAGRLLGALVSPVATFRSIRRRPTWVLALVVLTLVSLGSQIVIGSKMDTRKMLEQQMEARGQEVTEAQLDQMESFARIGPACNTLLVPVGYAVLALLFLVFVNLFGGELSFHQAMSVALHGLMPWLVAALLTTVVALGRTEIDPMQLQQQGGILASSLAFVAPEGAAPLVVVLLSAIDVFSLWSLVLLVVGLGIVGGVSTGAATGVVMVLWILWIGFRVALVGLGSGLGGGS